MKPATLCLYIVFMRLYVKGLPEMLEVLRTGMVRISGCSYVPEVPQTGIVYDDLVAM